MKQHNTVLLENRGAQRQPTRQDISNQIAQIKDEIRQKLVRAGSAAYRGRIDRALEHAKHAQILQDRLLVLADKAAGLASLDPVKDNLAHNRPSKMRVVIARKTFKTWASK